MSDSGNKTKPTPRQKASRSLSRQYLIVFAILGLAASFFALNYLIYIPLQQRSYNEKLFRILHKEAEEIEDVINSKADYIDNVKNNNANKEYLGRLAPGTGRGIYDSLHSSFKGYREGSQRSKVTYELRPDSVIFITDSTQKGDTSHLGIMLFPEIMRTIQSMNSRLFDHIVFVKRGTENNNVREQILYKTPGLGISNYINLDSSSGSKNSLLFSTIKELKAEGTSYKLFLFPFQLGENDVLLIGLISDRKFKIIATAYTFPTLLVIVSLLILIMISMPVMKIYLLGRKERITVTDVRGLMAVMVMAPFVFFLILATTWLFSFSDRHYNSLLTSLHRKVELNFDREITLALQQLRSYDDLCDNPDSSLAVKIYHDSGVVKQQQVDQMDTSDFKNVFFHPVDYKNIDLLFWVNKQGGQVAKWYFLNVPTTYINVETRQYFRDVRDGYMYQLSPLQDSFVLQPTISRTTGEYSINIVKRSHQTFQTESGNDTAIMIGMSTSMYSVCNPVVPKGFNFCIVDSAGNILMHSESFRNLHENLFEETDQNDRLKDAISNRDSQWISTRLYDRNVKMLVTPMKGMPFSLVSYYAERERNFFVFHVSAFTLLCTSLVLFFLLIYLLVCKILNSYKFSELHFHFYESALMRPFPAKKVLYVQFIGFVLITVLLLSLYGIITGTYLFTPQVSILLPFIITTGYYIVRRRWREAYDFKNSEYSAFSTETSTLPLFILFGLTLLIFYPVRNFLFGIGRGESHSSDIVLLFILIAILTSAYFSGEIINGIRRIAKNRLEKISKTRFGQWASNYLNQYVVVITLSILFNAVIPAIGFFTYALKEEVKTQIKSRQFDAAKKLENRRMAINDYVNSTKLNWEPRIYQQKDSEYVRQRKFSESLGIYLDSGSRILPVDYTGTPGTLPGNSRKNEPTYVDNSSFYRAITQFLFLPKDHTDFFNNDSNYYYWKRDPGCDSLDLIYYNQADVITKEGIQITTPFKPVAVIPELFANSRWLLFLAFLVILVQHIRFILPLSKRIFMIDFFDTVQQDDKYLDDIYGPLIRDHQFDNSIFGLGLVSQQKINKIEEQCIKVHKLGTPKADEFILKVQRLMKNAYDQVWKNCSPEERFILYDLALDGFSNYKNSEILYGLCEKGLIKKDREIGQLIICSYSFRNFLLSKTETIEITQLKQNIRKNSLWGNLKFVLLVLFFAVILFLFVTQEDVSNKIVAIVTGLVTVVPGLLKLFDRSMWEGSGGEK